MATKTAVGSAAWVVAEKENVEQMLLEEKEELIYPAQHEIEWLNEHMADIFSQSHMDVANIFKTPGKLKGKTPRTARKRAVESRMPLTDVFSSKPYQQSSPQKVTKISQFTVAKDPESDSQPQKSQADSGYHGSSQVEEQHNTPEIPVRSPLRVMKSPAIELRESEEENQTNEGSFHSAKENQTIKINTATEEPQKEEPTTQIDVPMEEAPVVPSAPEFDDIGSPSDESTPDRPLMRKKSSMTFASLPAREPLKQSIGNRVSRTSHVHAQKRDSHSARGKMANADQTDEEDADISDDGSNVEILGVDSSEIDSQAVRQYSKASTQRLHEKIDALGKAPAPRSSKSISSAANIAAKSKLVPEQPADRNMKETVEDEDDWIKPLPNAAAQQEAEFVAHDTDDEFDVRAPELIAHEERMSRLSPSPGKPMPGFGHTKSISTATLVSPSKTTMAPPPSPPKPMSVSNIPVYSTTPVTSPRRMVDGPLSASKSKLASIMKTAKGLFTSSASVSAAAKMEAITPKTMDKAMKIMPGMFPDIQKRLEDKPLPASPREGKRTRSSTEREREEKRKEKEARAMQQMEDQLAKAREQEKQKVAQQKAASPRKIEEDYQNIVSSSKPSRPVRPTKDIPKTKPQPVSIKVGTLSQRIPTGSSTMTSSTQETFSAEPKRPGLVKKASNASMQSSASTFKSSVSSQPTKPKALLAAERKREQDEKEAQRKLEQKREVERKRAVQQEEARRLEQEQRAEAERKERERLAAERAKRQAQQEAIERKRQDAVRKAEAQRAARDAAPSRPPSRLGPQATRPLINHAVPTNPAKPAKRPVEEDQVRPQASKYGAASQQTDAKRRRTEDENSELPARPTMSGAPIRQSQLGKKPSIFNHPAYTQASQPHISQFPQPPSRVPPQMSQFANSKIPFAEPSAAGPTKTPLSAYQHRTIQTVKSSPQQPQYQHGENIHLPEIPTDSEDEDSEDESNAFPIPNWATPGHLTEQLMRQEGMDGDAVFGPIAPLKMEEIFAKGNKDRLKRLRDRTSSANWIISGDGLTIEEVKIDREQRERMRLQGGWRYGA